MAIIVGTGDFKYRIVEDWAKLPDGWSFKEVGAVGVDAKDNVYVFNRGEHPVIVFDREGTFLRSWGEGVFRRAHGNHRRARRHALAHRRPPPHDSTVHARGEAAADDRRPRQAVDAPGRQALQP